MSSTKMNEWSADNLERAARFMRELDKSANARSAIDLARREQDVEMAKEAAKAKEAEANRVAMQAQAERVRWEEQRKTLEAKRENEKAVADYKLAKQREMLQEEDGMARRRDDDNRRKALEDERMKAAIRQKAEEEMQAERRRTDEHRARLERENMKARAVAEAEGRIKEQRENEDIFSRQARLRLEQERITRLEAINATFKNLGETISSFLSDPAKITAVVVGITAAAGGVYAMRESARVAGRLIEKRLGTPALVRETSRATNHFALRKRLARSLGLAKEEEGYSLNDVILRNDINERVSRLATSVRNTRANAAPYRHMLFYGPPGTGKTMVAKRLARTSGMDYAIMSGGDVGPLGRDAVTQLHAMFDWATTSRRGLLLFIDEADAFLASRSRAQMSEDQRNALNALLFRTGEANNRFMLVLATNRPGDLDRAVSDRVDESIVFDLPDEPARELLIKQYYQKYIVDAGKDVTGPLAWLRRSAAAIKVDDSVTPEYLTALAKRTAGFSGREISKLFISVQGNVYGRQTPTLTRDILEETVQWKLAEHTTKLHFGDSVYDYTALPTSASEAAASSSRSAVVNAGAGAPAAKPKLA